MKLPGRRGNVLKTIAYRVWSLITDLIFIELIVLNIAQYYGFMEKVTWEGSFVFVIFLELIGTIRYWHFERSWRKYIWDSLKK